MKSQLRKLLNEGPLPRHVALSTGLSIALLLVYFVRIVLHGEGRDFVLRVSEAKYFLNKINPYDVYVGTLPTVDAWGNPNAYSFVSYFFASPFTLIENPTLRSLFFGVLDIGAILAICGLCLRLLKPETPRLIPVMLLALLASPFFWRHVETLNYNFFAALGLVMVFYGDASRRIAVLVVGAFLVGLKPALAIPTLIVLICTSRWSAAALLISTVGLAGLLAATWLGVNPMDLLLQLRETQSRFSNGHTDGFFYFAKPYLHGQMLLLSISLSILGSLKLRRALGDPLCAVSMVVMLCLCLFYNHVHAWTLVVLTLAAALHHWLVDDGSFWIVVVLFAFLVTPRLAGLVPTTWTDSYVQAHNVLRFGSLAIATYALVVSKYAMHRSRPPIALSTSATGASFS